MKRGAGFYIVLVILIVCAIAAMIVFGFSIKMLSELMISAARAEDPEEERILDPLYVTASVLNGREEPTKKAGITAFFDYGD